METITDEDIINNVEKDFIDKLYQRLNDIPYIPQYLKILKILCVVLGFISSVMLYHFIFICSFHFIINTMTNKL